MSLEDDFKTSLSGHMVLLQLAEIYIYENQKTGTWMDFA